MSGTTRGRGPSDITKSTLEPESTSAKSSPTSTTAPAITVSSWRWTISPTDSPTAPSETSASSTASPTKLLGMGTNSGPNDTHTVTVSPFSSPVPGGGVWRSTWPATVPSWR